MIVNSNKTSLLCISNTRTDTETYIKDGDEVYKSSETLKRLDFNFRSSVSMQTHNDEIKTKVSRRVWTLINLKRAGVERKDILSVYYSKFRSVIEYAIVT